MKRRKAVKNIALSAAGGLFLPTLSGCNTNDDNGPNINSNVVVIGAGVAGLKAAQLLRNEGVPVQILEARGVPGGRIETLERFSDFPYELGADEILGTSNSWYDLVQSTGVPLVPRTGALRYQLDDNVGTGEDFAQDSDFLLAQAFRNEIPSYSGSDVTVQSAIQTSGINSRVHHIMEGEIGNRFGSSNSAVGMRGIATASRATNQATDLNVTEGQSLSNIVRSVFSDVISLISYNSPVVAIEYSGDKIIIGIDGGESLEADKVVIAVPITILKDSSISFNPSLPTSKQNALSNLGMDAGMKVAMAFNANFWGTDVESIFLSGSVPQYYAPGVGRSSTNSVLAAYLMGSHAEAFQGMEDSQIFDVLIGELDLIYEGNASRLVSRDIDGNIQGVIKDWTNESYIKGAYSYPKVGATLARETLALSVNDKLFFAGEATSTNGDFGTVQGALDSADRVAEEIIEVLAKERA